MDRMDLYSTVHKGLRAALFDAARQVASTDFQEAESAAANTSCVRTLLGFLEEHAEHEDRTIMPIIAQLGSAVYADLQADHNKVAGLQTEIETLLERLADAGEGERVALGRRLHDKMGRLVAEHLLHMEREEITGNRLLWAHLSDEELRAVHGRILGAIPPERMREWAGILLPSIGPKERAAMLAGLEANLPPERYAEFVAIAERPFAFPSRRAA